MHSSLNYLTCEYLFLSYLHFSIIRQYISLKPVEHLLYLNNNNYQKFQYISMTTSSSSSMSYTPETKSDIIALAIGNPANKSKAKLSQKNQTFLGYGIADLLIKRHNHELQRCSQFYSLASIYNETSTKDKHRMKMDNIKKLSFSGRKYILRFFICF
jgi:hypothetical protein